MIYSDAQYSLLKKLLPGIRCTQLSDQELETLVFLDSQGFVQYRVQIADDYAELSQLGQRVLAQYLQDLSETESMANEKTQQKRQQRFENKIAVANLLVPLVTFFLGILVEHFAGICAFAEQLLHDLLSHFLG